MAELKTQRTSASVTEFLSTIKDEGLRKDCKTLVQHMKKVTGFPPKMWGSSIVGFGSFHYKSSSGQEGDWYLTGFSPRKQNLTIYVMPGFKEHSALMKKLGKHTAGSSCLYVKNLNDVHLPTLAKLIKGSVAFLKKRYG